MICRLDIRIAILQHLLLGVVVMLLLTDVVQCGLMMAGKRTEPVLSIARTLEQAVAVAVRSLLTVCPPAVSAIA